MDRAVDRELYGLLRVLFGLDEAGKEWSVQPVRRPSGVGVLEEDWLEELVEAIAGEILSSFDLRVRSAREDGAEVERWRGSVRAGGWVERRRNHRLRIRTAVDDLFEGYCTHSDVTATLRAWKLQLADACADVILSRFHVRPASNDRNASARRVAGDIGEDLEEALNCRKLFLMTGRDEELEAMKAAIERAYRATLQLMGGLKPDGAEGDPRSG
jgi:hypothetical protein